MIGNDWDIVLKDLFASEKFINLYNFVNQEYESKVIYPEKVKIFEALKLTSYKNTKVVIVGQDPYHGEGEAHGLSFSVLDGIPIPPSLKNIYKELHEDIGCDIPTSGNLTKWAKEGVLLLNATLTVIKDTPNSHSKIGWTYITDEIIKSLNNHEEPIVFILWGNYAVKKKKLITNSKHLVLESSHPSPLGVYRGFSGSKPFSKTNDFLIKNGIKPIDWDLNKKI